MKIKSFTFFFVLISLSQLISGKDNSNYSIVRFKIYVNGTYNYEQGHYTLASSPILGYDYLFKKESFDFGDISMGIEISNRKSFTHEFELMPLSFNHSDELYYIDFESDPEDIRIIDGGKTLTFESAIRYQLNYYFINNKLVNPYIGIASKLYYNYLDISPATSSSYSTTIHNLGLQLSIIPSILIALSEKIAIDINIPFCFYDIKFEKSKIENPLIPVDERINTNFIGEFIPNYLYVRIGITYKIK